MNRSASTREYINMVCRKQYKKYSNAAQYITNLELKASDFKNLVDYEYYKEGGYPSPQTPAKLWSLFNKYNEAMRMMNRYGFTQQNSLINEQNKNNYNSVTNIKYPLNNKFNIQENYLRLFGKKIKSENKIKFKKTFLLIKKDKIKDNEKILRFKPQRKQKNYQINQANSIGGRSGSLMKPIK